MKTEDLITLLATGTTAVDRKEPVRRAWLALAAGLVGSAVLTVSLLGLAPALAQELLLPAFWVRAAFCAAVGASALLCAWRLAHPGTRLGLAPAGLAVPVLLMWSLAVYVLFDAGPANRTVLLLGQTAKVCSALIALVSAPVFAAVVWAMRRYAPTRLRLCGAAAGLASGGVGALVYTLHCPELAPPFLAVWYVLGMLAPAFAGAWLGPRLLRW